MDPYYRLPCGNSILWQWTLSRDAPKVGTWQMGSKQLGYRYIRYIPTIPNLYTYTCLLHLYYNIIYIGKQQTHTIYNDSIYIYIYTQTLICIYTNTDTHTYIYIYAYIFMHKSDFLLPGAVSWSSHQRSEVWAAESFCGFWFKSCHVSWHPLLADGWTKMGKPMQHV